MGLLLCRADDAGTTDHVRGLFAPFAGEGVVNVAEMAVGAGLVLVLLGLAAYYGWRQRVAARSLASISDDDTRLYLRRQIRRRLLCSWPFGKSF